MQTERDTKGTTVVPRDVLDVAREAALRAGAELNARYGRPPRGLGAKQGPTDLVSDADRAAEAAIAAVLARRRPDDGILGEEGTANRDGHDRPALGRRPARRHRELPLRHPAVVREHRLRGRRRHARGRRPRPAARPGPSPPSAAARCASTRRAPASAARRPRRRRHRRRGGLRHGRGGQARRQARKRLFRRVGQRRTLGTAALELAWAAAGRIDVVYHEQRIHPWDVDAGLFICQRAGLRVHRLEPLEPELAPRFLAAPPALAAEVLELVGPSAKERRRRAAERPPLSAERVAEAMRRRRAGG